MIHYKSLKIGDRVRTVQAPDDFDHVIEQFLNRTGRVAVKHNYDDKEYRILIAFDEAKNNNDLWITSESGEFTTIEYATPALYSGEYA